MEKKTYVTPLAEVIRFESMDIIVTSGTSSSCYWAGSKKGEEYFSHAVEDCQLTLIDASQGQTGHWVDNNTV